MKYLRPTLIFVIIALPIWVAMNHVPHHQASSPIETLYLHLMPAKLMTSDAMGHDEHAGETEEEHAAHADDHGASHGSDDYLLAFTLPGVPAIFDMDKDPVMEGTQHVATNLQLFQLAAVLLLLPYRWCADPLLFLLGRESPTASFPSRAWISAY